MEPKELESITEFSELKSVYYKKYFDMYKRSRDKDLSDFYAIVVSEIKHKSYNDPSRIQSLKGFIDR